MFSKGRVIEGVEGQPGGMASEVTSSPVTSGLMRIMGSPGCIGSQGMTGEWREMGLRRSRSLRSSDSAERT